MTVKMTVEVRGGDALVATFDGAYERMRSELLRAVTRLSIQVQGSVKADKLTGQVLHVRTGTLRRSISQRVEHDESRVVGYVGTNVVYGAVHEYGFQGAVNVRQYVRRTRTGSTTVRSHTRIVNLPERSFLRSTLRDFEVEIKDTLRAAALRAVTQ